MSGIVLSASVRQNLLSLQSTAALLATTQNDLATGNKVNSALDNPTSYFTAQSLNNRASDINNLLDGIGNGVQVLQAANTGITSLQSLVANAQSIANQVLQTPAGYSTKSTVTSAAITGATANNLLGTGADQRCTVTGTTSEDDTTSGGYHRCDPLVGTAWHRPTTWPHAITNGSVLTVDGKNITFSTGRSRPRLTAAAMSPSASATAARLTVQTVAQRDRRHHRCFTASTSTVPASSCSARVPPRTLVIGGGDRHRSRRSALARRQPPITRPRSPVETLNDRRHRRRHGNEHHLRHRHGEVSTLND